MLTNIFSSILTNGTFTAAQFGVATITSLLCGFFIATAFMVKNKCSQSFAITLALLPSIVELVIILVNGNIGTGVAVAGAFSLVRFRSVAGRGQEITSVFLAMAVGLATGMGYIGVAVLFSVLISFLNILLNVCKFGDASEGHRTLKITVPENLDYEGKFEDIFQKYLTSYSYEEVKTSNMGSLYKITLDVVLKSGISTKAMLDEIRTRNGNLDISLGRQVDKPDCL
ncbi:MAG: DUF4956 domain-containing protein [Lachnospiraceae bacterium]|nr:DUF4956 domain-containing protein [Lachnospiraceae bacterium]